MNIKLGFAAFVGGLLVCSGAAQATHLQTACSASMYRVNDYIMMAIAHPRAYPNNTERVSKIYIVRGRPGGPWVSNEDPSERAPSWYATTAGWLYETRNDGDGRLGYLWRPNGTTADPSVEREMDYVPISKAAKMIRTAQRCRRP